MEKGRLMIWEPLKVNPFSRFENPMNFVRMNFEGDFVLVFEEFNRSKEYIFNYKQDKSNFQSAINFRFLEEATRPDIESLISKLGIEREKQGLSKLAYDPTFYKVKNSSFLSWYSNIDSTLFDIHPHIEHHLYITSEFMIDVLSEHEPIVSISTKEDRANQYKEASN